MRRGLHHGAAPAGLKAGRFDRAELLASVKGVLLLTLTPVIILGGILGGLFTPTEAVSVAVVYVLLIAVGTRSLSWSGFRASVRETVITTAGIMLIVAAAALLGHILARERLPRCSPSCSSGSPSRPSSSCC